MKKLFILLVIILGMILISAPSFSQRVSPADVQEYTKSYPGMGALTPAEIKKGLKRIEGREKGTETELPEETPPPIKEKAEISKQKISEAFPNRLPVFGQQLFSDGPASFTPPSNMPVSVEYIVGPDDNIIVQLWGRLNEQYTLTVQRDGSIQFPQIGTLQVAGLTYKQLQDLIKRKAESITGVNVSVSMGELRSITVFVVGAVKQPGAYTVSAFDTILNAMIYAGGPDIISIQENDGISSNEETEDNSFQNDGI